MTPPEPSFDDLVAAFHAKLDRVQEEMSFEEVREILGDPASVVDRSAAKTPSDHFADFGSMFQFGDAASDTLWVYRDGLRPTHWFFLAFAEGILSGSWTEERDADKPPPCLTSG